MWRSGAILNSTQINPLCFSKKHRPESNFFIILYCNIIIWATSYCTSESLSSALWLFSPLFPSNFLYKTKLDLVNVNFKSNRVKLRKWGDKIMQNFASDNTDSVFCIERSRINIWVICLQFCKLMFGESNFVKSLFSHNRVKTYDCGERIAGWFSMFLGRPCRLIRQSSDMKKKSHQKNIKGMFSFLKIFVIPHLVNIRLMDFMLSIKLPS